MDVNNITNKPLLEILNGISDGNHNLKVFDGNLFSDLSRELYLATFIVESIIEENGKIRTPFIDIGDGTSLLYFYTDIGEYANSSYCNANSFYTVPILINFLNLFLKLWDYEFSGIIINPDSVNMFVPKSSIYSILYLYAYDLLDNDYD